MMGLYIGHLITQTLKFKLNHRLGSLLASYQVQPLKIIL
jgi:hypothetical protein